MLLKEGVFTYRQLMWKIPYAVILAMINDQGRIRKKKEEEKVIQSEEEEMAFFGLK